MKLRNIAAGLALLYSLGGCAAPSNNRVQLEYNSQKIEYQGRLTGESGSKFTLTVKGRGVDYVIGGEDNKIASVEKKSNGNKSYRCLSQKQCPKVFAEATALVKRAKDKFNERAKKDLTNLLK